MQKWEYKHVSILDTVEIGEVLNKYAAQGWELLFWDQERAFIFRRSVEK